PRRRGQPRLRDPLDAKPTLLRGVVARELARRERRSGSDGAEVDRGVQPGVQGRQAAPAVSTPEMSPQLGEHVRRARLRRGLSLRELARRIGIHHSTLSKIENEKSTPEMGTVVRIAEQLDLPPSELASDHADHCVWCHQALKTTLVVTLLLLLA